MWRPAGGGISTEAYVTFFGVSINTLTDTGTTSILDSGLLPAGEYTIRGLANIQVAGRTNVTGSGDFAYELTLTQVPEPSTALLLAPGLAALALRRRAAR